MAFGNSTALAWKFQTAARQAVEAESRKLLSRLGEDDPAFGTELAETTVTQGMLSAMVIANINCKPCAHRDERGNAAAKFFAAQCLVSTVLRSRALDVPCRYSAEIAQALGRGGEALFEVGRSQFESLGKICSNLLLWIANHHPKGFVIIESPLGNSLPVQVVCDFAKARDIECKIVEWNAPRNDRAARGRTIGQAAIDCASKIGDCDLVVFMDDANTGTRFIKLYDALLGKIGAHRFLPIVMQFESASGCGKTDASLERLEKRVNEQGLRIGYPFPIVKLPPVELFKMDWGPPVRWHARMMWAESDLIAGKRKVNLIFTLIDHCFDILDDLGEEKSRFRSYLEKAWQQDTTGMQIQFAPGILQATFRGISEELPTEKGYSRIWHAAKAKFPSDYRGESFSLGEIQVKERWDWLRDSFQSMARETLGEQRSVLAWRAIDDTFAASFSEHAPRPARDQDATPFTFPFNSTVGALNIRLREKFVASVIGVHA
jgi:hypothetical protein